VTIAVLYSLSPRAKERHSTEENAFPASGEIRYRDHRRRIASREMSV
jgi:hypothetical protein